MNRCWGRTGTFRRCGRQGNWKLFFCDDHRLQPIGWAVFLAFTVAGGAASIYSVFRHRSNQPSLQQEAYRHFAAEKSRRIASYSQGTFLQLKMTALIGQKQVSRLRHNTGLDAELQKTSAEYEEWLSSNAKAEEEFQSELSAIKLAWPSNPELVRLIDTVREPYRVHIEQAPPLDKIEDEKQWLKTHTAELNAEFDRAVKAPLDRLEKYLDEAIAGR